MKRRLVLGAGSAALLATLLPCRAADLATGLAPAAAEPAAPRAAVPLFTALNLDWVDTRRQRAVPARLYLPPVAAPGPSMQPPVPLVVFSHGIGGSRNGYSYLGQHWASNGVASLHVQHVGSDRSLWSGNVLLLASRLQAAAQETEALARVADLRFALDQLLASELAGRIDRQYIIAAGHSYGANTSLLAAGARVEREGQLLPLRDERLAAALLISAPPFYGETQPRRVLASVTMPTLHVTATEDIIRIPGYYSGADDRVAVYEATGSTRKWLAVFAGGSHSMFTDRTGTGGSLLNPQVKAATKELALAFVRNVAGLEQEPLQAWPKRHASLLARADGFVA